MLSFFRIQKKRTTIKDPKPMELWKPLSKCCQCTATRTRDEVLPQVMMAYRASAHSSTSIFPNMMMLGRNRNHYPKALARKWPGIRTKGICPYFTVEVVKSTWDCEKAPKTKRRLPVKVLWYQWQYNFLWGKPSSVALWCIKESGCVQ